MEPRTRSHGANSYRKLRSIPLGRRPFHGTSFFGSIAVKQCPPIRISSKFLLSRTASPALTGSACPHLRGSASSSCEIGSSQPFPTHSGTVFGWHAVAQDVTGRRCVFGQSNRDQPTQLRYNGHNKSTHHNVAIVYSASPVCNKHFILYLCYWLLCPL